MANIDWHQSDNVFSMVFSEGVFQLNHHLPRLRVDLCDQLEVGGEGGKGKKRRLSKQVNAFRCANAVSTYWYFALRTCFDGDIK